MTHLKINIAALFLLLSSLTIAQENPWHNPTSSDDPWGQEGMPNDYQDSISQRDINRFVSGNYKTNKEFGRSLLTCTFLSAFGTPVNFVKTEKESERAVAVYNEFKKDNPRANEETLLKVRKKIRSKRNKTRVGGSIVGTVISAHIIGFIALFN